MFQYSIQVVKILHWKNCKNFWFNWLIWIYNPDAYLMPYCKVGIIWNIKVFGNILWLFSCFKTLWLIISRSWGFYHWIVKKINTLPNPSTFPFLFFVSFIKKGSEKEGEEGGRIKKGSAAEAIGSLNNNIDRGKNIEVKKVK